MLARWIIRFFVLVWMGATFPAQGAPPGNYYDLPKVVAVQNRTYYLNHDLTFNLGLLPSDAFNKGYTLGGSYTYFFNDYFGWEVINAHYSFNRETNLKKDLLENFEVEVENVGFGGILDYITYYFTTSFTYTPLYTKSLLFNKHIVHGEVSFIFGAGGVNFDQSGLRALITAGVYFRLFSSKRSSWKFNFRNNVYFEDSLGVVNAFSMMLGYSIQLGSPPRQPISSEELERE